VGLTIHLLGVPAIYGGDDSRNGLVRGQKAWALLARILLADRPLSRHVIASELFSDTVDPLGSVRWCLASLRRAIGRQAFIGDPIQAHLPVGAVVDVWDIAGSDGEILHAGQLLEGINPQASAEFSTWLLVERERLASLVDERIRQETLVAMSAGDYVRAIRIAEAGARRRPYEENSHVLLAKCLVLGGRPDAALEQVAATEKNFLSEIGEKPSPALRSAARQTVSAAALSVAPRAFAESLIETGIAALSAGAVDSGLDCLRRAAAEAEILKDNYLTAKSLVELGSALVHSVRGFDNEGATLLRKAVAMARQCGDGNIASRGLCELGYVEAFAGRRPEAARLLNEAIVCSGPDRNRLAGIHAVIGFNLVDWGNPKDGLSHFELSLEHARSVGNRRREIWSLGLGGWGQLAADRPDTACEWIESCLAACHDLRWLAFRPWPLSVQAAARLQLKENPRS
jgi:DNA-binding SARP family transcriptional activator